MKVLSSLRKRTKTGTSVWCFCYDAEMKRHYAVGGESLKVIPADDKAHLGQIYRQFTTYGYTRKLPKERPLVSDPWDSSLPLDMQLQLDALAA